GAGGLPARGESRLGGAAIRTLGDLMSHDLRGKRVLVVGDGHSAANAIVWLERVDGVQVTWAIRTPNLRPCDEVTNDPLPERASAPAPAPGVGASEATAFPPAPGAGAGAGTGTGNKRHPHVQLRALDTLWFQVAGTICNIECTHCFISCSPRNHSHEMMSLADVQRSLDDARGLGVREYYFTGGEPFMNRDMLAILEATLKQGP